MKKRVIIEVVCGILIFVVGFFIGDASAIKRVNEQIGINVTKQDEEQKTEEVKVNNENKNDDSKKDPKIYQFGQEGVSGDWDIKVLEAKEADTIEAGNSEDNIKSSLKFIIVKLEMKNISKEPIQYSPEEFILGNMNDKTQYKADLNAMLTANGKETIYNRNNNFIGAYEDVNPNTPKETYVIFEVPKEVKIENCVLVNGNNNSEGVGYYLK